MCGIFGGFNLSFDETEKGINLLKEVMTELQSLN